MSKTRNLSDLLDANGDVKSTALDNVPASNDASALTTGTLDNARLPTNIDISGTSNFQGKTTHRGGSSYLDNDKLTLGTSDDLEIYHDASNSYIKDVGTGNLLIQGNGTAVIIEDTAGNNNVVAYPNGATTLSHGGTSKLATSSTGVTVTGTLTADGVSLGDNDVLNLGASNDLQISHDGNNSLIADTGTGDLFIRGSNNIYLQNAGGTTMSRLASGAGNYLYYNGSQKFETTSSGVSVTGDLSVTGSISGAGKVGQVVQSVKTDTSSTSSSSWSAISGLSADITPSSTSSKILVSFNLNVGQSNSTTAVFRLYRGTTAIGLGESAGSRLRVTGRVSPDNVHWTFPISNEFLDSPNTTSSVGYAVYWRNNGNTVFINRNNSNNNDGSNDQSRPISNITLTEILA